MAILAVVRRISRVPTSFTSAFVPRPPRLGTVYLDTNSPPSAYAVISANRKRSPNDQLDGAEVKHVTSDFKLRRTDEPALASLRGKRGIDEVHWVDFLDRREFKGRRLVTKLNGKDEVPGWEEGRAPWTWTVAVSPSTEGDNIVGQQNVESREENQADSATSATSTASTASANAADISPSSTAATNDSTASGQTVEVPKEAKVDSSAVMTDADKVDSSSPASTATAEAVDESLKLDEVINKQPVEPPKEVDAASTAAATEANTVDSSSSNSTVSTVSTAWAASTDAADEPVQLDNHVKLYDAYIAWVEANQLDNHVKLYKAWRVRYMAWVVTLPDDDESSDYAPEPSDDECDCIKNGLVDCIVDHSDPDSDDESFDGYDFLLDLAQDPEVTRRRREAAAPPAAAGDDDSDDELFPIPECEKEMADYADWCERDFQAVDDERRSVLEEEKRKRQELRALGRSNFSSFSTPAPLDLLARFATSSSTSSPALFSAAATATTGDEPMPSIWDQQAHLATGSSGFAASPAAFGQVAISPAVDDYALDEDESDEAVAMDIDQDDEDLAAPPLARDGPCTLLPQWQAQVPASGPSAFATSPGAFAMDGRRAAPVVAAPRQSVFGDFAPPPPPPPAPAAAGGPVFAPSRGFGHVPTSTAFGAVPLIGDLAPALVAPAAPAPLFAQALGFRNFLPTSTAFRLRN
ncbi:hypothetical protein JCM9279_000030 [Rhodotorula babjevae]